MNSSVRPGYTTSEFWQALLAQILSAVVGLGTLFHAHFDLAGVQALIPSIAVLAAAIASGLYAHGRSVLKSAATAAASSERIANGL